MRRLPLGILMVAVFGGLVQMSGETARADQYLGAISDLVPGDADRDGDVDFADFNTVANNYTGPLAGVKGVQWEDGDFDADNDVDFADFNSLANNYTGPKAPLTAPIPEPTTFVIWCLLGTLLIAVGCWRSRRKTA